MYDDFVIARNPDDASTLPYLIRLPLGREGVVLKARDTWPRTAKIYCHRADGWPADAEIVERVGVTSCVRRGAAIDLVLSRGRENRSQIVFTRIRGGREAIFWQTARTAKQARPNVSIPTRRASGHSELEIVVDVHERYPYRFTHQQVRTTRRALSAGDYAVCVGDEVVAAVERKSLADLSASLLSGRLKYALGELASLHRAAVVVEDRYSEVFRLAHVRPGVVADALAEAQVRWPEVPIVFAETRPLAEEWTFRYLGAALTDAEMRLATADLETTMAPAGQLAAAAPTTAAVRAWARANGVDVPPRGRVRREVWDAYGVALAELLAEPGRQLGDGG